MRVAVGAILVCALVLALGFKSEEAPIFITAPLERGSIATVVKATGTVDPVATVDVSSQFSGRIADVFVNFNDFVKAGQPIARLDPETFNARVNEAKAALKIAQANVQVQIASLERSRAAIENAQAARSMAEAQLAALRAKFEETEKVLRRYLMLVKDHAVSESDLDKSRAQRDVEAADIRASAAQIDMKREAIVMADAELQMARASVVNAEAVVEQKQATLEQAQLDHARATLRAPIDGIVIKRDVNPGQTIAVSLEARTLFKIANDLREMEVHGKIDEADIGLIKVEQPVQFTVDAYPDRTFLGHVIQIRKAPEIVQNVVTYTAIISAPNQELLLLPGMTAQLRIVVTDTGEVLKIPNQALRFRPYRQDGRQSNSSTDTPPTVWLVGKDGQSTPVTVKTGASDDSSTELTEGPLTVNQRLIVGVGNSQNKSRLFGIRLGF
jgi:HlyD family secretion protein